jgi:hypothetical protein
VSNVQLGLLAIVVLVWWIIMAHGEIMSLRRRVKKLEEK